MIQWQPLSRKLSGLWPLVQWIWLKSERIIFNWIWIIIGLYGAFTIFINVRHGIGVTHDTLHYFSAAENFIKGNGLYTNFYGKSEPLVWYQPFYSIVLGVASLGIFSLEETALVLNALLMGGNAILIFYLMRKATSFAIIPVTISVLAFLLSHYTIPAHLMAWTEPLFIFLMLSGFLAFDHCFSSKDGYVSKPYLFLAGLPIALAILTRYAGLILLPVFLLIILIQSRERLSNQIKAMVYFLLPSMAIVGGWLMRNQSLAGNPTERTIEFSAFPDFLWEQFKNAFISIYFGNSDGIVFFWSSVAITTVLMFLALFQYLRNPLERRIQGYLAIFGISYITFILTLPLLGNNIYLKNRMLLPFFTALIVGGVSGAFNAVRTMPKKVIFYVLLIGIGVKWVSDLSDYSNYMVWVSRERGLGFNGEKWRQKTQLTYTRNLPKEALIFAHKPQYKYAHYLTERTIYPMDSLPAKMEASGKRTHGYVLFTNPCCENGETPSLPDRIAINKTIIDQKLYRVQLRD